MREVWNKLGSKLYYESETKDACADNFPCTTCAQRDVCDGWEARYCCTLCRYFNDEPDCDSCDPMDI